LTQDEAHGELLRRHDDVILAYPVYFSDLPQIVREFICKNSANFRGKNVFIIATMEIFSGDGAGCAARILGRAGAKITGGTHVKMPAFILDVAIFSYLAQKNERLINDANAKLQRVARASAAGNPPQEGLGTLCRIAGLLGQRLWMKIWDKTPFARRKPSLDTSRCNGCGECAKFCPMQNIKIAHGKARFGKRCTLCYRCVNKCRQKAITILGKAVNLEKSVAAKFKDI
jgi:ferredoxin